MEKRKQRNSINLENRLIRYMYIKTDHADLNRLINGHEGSIQSAVSWLYILSFSRERSSYIDAFSDTWPNSAAHRAHAITSLILRCVARPWCQCIPRDILYCSSDNKHEHKPNAKRFLENKTECRWHGFGTDWNWENKICLTELLVYF